MKRKLLMSFGLVLGLLWQTIAQDRVVTGKVTSSEDASALPGVSVAIKGTTRGTSTNGNGEYKISVPNNATLTYSLVGFAQKSVKIGTQSIINVAIEPSIAELQEVSVVAYGTQSKKSVTGAQTQINAAQINGVSMTSVDKALQGQVAGLQSTASSGQPGATQAIRIRGIGSITAGSDPLYVVDGIPIISGDQSRLQTTSNTLARPRRVASTGSARDKSAASRSSGDVRRIA